MSANILIQTGINALLGGDATDVLAKNATDKVVSTFNEHFTFTSFEISATYQNSYGYALAAISAGLAAPEQKLAFIRKFAHAKIKREFSDPIDALYFQAFVEQRSLYSEEISALRGRLVEKIKLLANLSLNFNLISGDKRRLSESELVAAIHHQESLMLTEYILGQLRAQFDGDGDGDYEDLFAFLSFKDLLGKATLHFFLEILRRDSRVKTTFSVLQGEGIWADVRDIKKAQQNLSATLQQQIDELRATAMRALEMGDFSGAHTPQLQRLQLSLDEVPQRLKAAHAAMQASHKDLIDFSRRFEDWAGLLDVKVEQVLDGMGLLQVGIAGVADEVKELKQLLLQFMGRFDLSVQVKPQDEFTHFSSQNLDLIQAAMAKLKGLSSNNRDYSQLVMMAGSVASSTGDLAEAEKLFVQARKAADSGMDKRESALASFNLFHVRVRRGAYEEALCDLNAAIKFDSKRFALHDVEKYPICKLLGAGGMGCVFLCEDEWGENKVVVKCFWQGRKGRREDVFSEVFIMRKLKSPYVPKTLGYGYVNNDRQDRPYFVTEYLEGALDGEAWLAKYGKLDLQSGLDVGVQVAQGLAVAHKAGVFHFDLKPANLLLKKVDDHLVVKIIDFGLARVGTSLREQAARTRARSGQSVFIQDIFGTFDYAPPEQWGESLFGKPGAKSDVFAFGTSLYRLLSGKRPGKNLRQRDLPKVPELYELLEDCVEEDPVDRPDSGEVLRRLLDLLPSSSSDKLEKVVKLNPSFSKKIEETRKPGEVFRNRLMDGSEGPAMVWIKAGKFRMGDIQGNGRDNEKPVHEVSLGEFAMGRFPVTFAEYDLFAEATGKEKPNDSGWGRDNRPVINVSWNDAVAYADWLSQQTGKEYRLPTEAEWEYAARAGTETDYWWGNEVGKNRANFDGSGSQWSDKQTSPVGSFEPNPFGLYDTVGNVWEWVRDWYGSDYYSNSPPHDPNGPSTGKYRVLRGGAWSDTASLCRAANRGNSTPGYRVNSRGFRLLAC